MNRIVLVAAVAAAILPATPALARDTSGHTVRTTALRAGPDSDYPRIARLPANAEVKVYGCLDDRSWCDVSRRNARGWIEGSDLAITYRGRRTALRAGLGIGILSFTFGNYWDDHYRGQSFYGQRSRWEHNSARPGERRWSNQPGRMDDPRGQQGWQQRQPGGMNGQGGQRDWQQRQPGGMNGQGGQQGWQQHQPAAPLDRTIPGGQTPRPRDWQPMITPDRTMPGGMQGMPMNTTPSPSPSPPDVGVHQPHQPGDAPAGNANGRHKHAD